MPWAPASAPRQVTWWWWVLVAITVAPIVSAGWHRETSDWYPEGDDATIVLLSHDTFSSHPPQLGMISTGGAHLDDPELHHPGPIELYLLAPFGRGPSAVPGVTIAATAIGVASVVGLGLALRSLGGRGLGAAGLLAAGMVTWGLGGDVPGSVWNPFVVALPFAWFLALAVATAAGRRWLLPWMLAVGSFVMQTHLSYLGMVGLVTAWTIGVVAWRWWRHPETRQGTGQVLAWSAGVVAIVWAAPVYQQLTGQPGNLAQIVRAAGAADGDATGWSGLAELARIVGVPFLGWTPRPDIVRVFGDLDPLAVVRLTIPCVVVVALWVVARRRGDSRVAATVATSAVIVVAAAVTATRIPRSDGVVYQYYGLWMGPVAVLSWLLWGWSALRLAGATDRRISARTGRVLVGATLVAAAIVAVLPRPGAWEPWKAYRRIAGDVAVTSVRDLAGGAYVVRFRGGTAYLSTGSAVTEALEQAGHRAYVDPGVATPIFPWTERRRYDDQPVSGELWVVSGDDPVDLPSNARLVARAPALTDGERVQFEDRRRELVDALERDGLRPGPRPPSSPADRALLDDTGEQATRDPEAALASGAVARLAAQGVVEPPGGDLHAVTTDARMGALADEGDVRVYLVT